MSRQIFSQPPNVRFLFDSTGNIPEAEKLWAQAGELVDYLLDHAGFSIFEDPEDAGYLFRGGIRLAGKNGIVQPQ